MVKFSDIRIRIFFELPQPKSKKLVAYCLFQVTGGKNFTPPTSKINKDLSRYALQIRDEVGFSERTLEGISNSVNSFIAELEEGSGLLELLNQSTGFNGVKHFDSDDNEVEPLQSSVELVKSWSLTIVTLTCIVVSLPRIPKDVIQSLMKSVVEGLSYTHFCEGKPQSIK